MEKNNNRKLIHINARTGLGGVGFFIKKCFTESYVIDVIDDDCDGWYNVLRICGKNAVCHHYMIVYVIYRQKEYLGMLVCVFYDILRSNIYCYQNMGPTYKSGDFISGVGKYDDNIVGKDDISCIEVTDFKTNPYLDKSQDFLINGNKLY